MELYILRHAEAGVAPRDEDRELTDHGRQSALAVAGGIASMHLGVESLICSPLVRAVQTAYPASKALTLSCEIADGLSTGRSPEEALKLVSAHRGPVLLVGHEPQLSGIVLAATGGRIHMRKAMLACIELDSLDPVTGRLAWLLTWQHLRKLS